MSEASLTAGFAPADEAAWRALVDKVLAGRPFDRALVSTTRDDIRIEPLYPQRAAGQPLRAGSDGWTVVQRVDHPDFSAANEIARAEIDGGAGGLELVLPGAPGANGYGVPIRSLDDVAAVLDGIDLTTVRLRLDGGYESRPGIVYLAAYVGHLGLDPAAVDVTALSDPANGLVAMGRLTASYEAVCERTVDMAHALLAKGLALSPLVADGRAVHAAGGSEAQELAYALADGIEHLRVLERGGVALEDARRLVSFSFAADVDQFATIAKLRAFRVAWARVEEACGLEPAPARVHAETAWRMLARRDPWVNILRGAVAVAAAGMGGADSVTCLPFTQARGLPDPLARRIARNTQLVLINEAGLARVGDPTAGSGYVEALTAALAEKAWTGFQEIEAEGGIIGSLVGGRFQRRIAEVRNRRAADVATRREPLTGVSEYALLEELPVTTLDAELDGIVPAGEKLSLPRPEKGVRFEALVDAAHAGATMADMLATVGAEWVRVDSLPRIRLAAPFEALRDRCDRASDRDGLRPTVFLATIGGRADFAARAGWVRNVFAAGGFAAAGGETYEDQAALVRAFRTSGAEAACLCGSDAGYESAAAVLAAALKSTGLRALYLAGRPGEAEAGLRAAGIDGFVHAGCDILSVLQDVQRRLGLDAVTDDA